MRKRVPSVICLVLLVALAGACWRSGRINREKERLGAELERVTKRGEEKAFQDVLADLSLPAEVLHMDRECETDLRRARRDMLKRQGHTEIIDSSRIAHYPRNWHSFRGAPLHLFGLGDASYSWLESSYRGKTLETLWRLAESIRRKDGVGDFLARNPEVFDAHVRPLVLRLLKGLAPSDVSAAARVLIASGDRSEEFRSELRRLFCNPRFHNHYAGLLGHMRRHGYEDWASSLETIGTEKRKLWAGTSEKLQADHVFASAVPVRDANGDPLPKGALARLGTKRFRQAGWRLVHLDLGVDGKSVRATVDVGAEETVTVTYDMETGQVLEELRRKESHRLRRPMEVRGGRVILMDDDRFTRSLVVKDIVEGKELLVLPEDIEHRYLRCARLTPDGRTLAVLRTLNDRPTLVLWDMDTGTKTTTGELRRIGNAMDLSIRHLVCTPDGTCFVSLLPDRSVAAWRRADGKLLFRTDSFGRDARGVHVSKDSKCVYVQVQKGGGFIVYDISTGNVLGRHAGSASYLSADLGQVAFSARVPSPPMEKPPNGYEVCSLPGLEKIGTVSTHGTLMAVGRDRVAVYLSERQSIQLLDIRSGSVVGELKCGAKPHKVLLSPDGKKVVEACTRSGSAIRVWDVAEQRSRYGIGGHLGDVQHILQTEPGRKVLSFGGTDMLRWEARDGEVSLHSRVRFESAIPLNAAVCVRPDGEYVATRKGRSPAQFIEVRKVGSEEVLASLRTHGTPTAWAFHPNARLMAVGYSDGKICRWDLQTEKVTHTYPAGEKIETLTFSRVGNWLACRTPKHVCAWPLSSASDSLPVLRYEHKGRARAISLTSCGRRLVMLGSRREHGGYTRVVETDSSKTVCEFWTGAMGHGLAISPDDRFLAITFLDGRVQVHSLETGEQFVVYRGHGVGRCVATFSPDGRTIFTGGADTTILQWRLPSQCLTLE